MKHSCADAQALVFDLGGTYLRCAVWDSCKSVSSLRRIKIDNFLHTDAGDVWDGLVAHIQEYAASFGTNLPSEAPIVIAFAGPVKDRKTILQAPTVLGGTTKLPNLAEEVERRTGHTTYLLNDISAAAWYISLNAPAARFMVTTVSSGIGSKLFDSSHPLGVLDAHPWAGEIGHVVVDHSLEAPVCDCGQRGHLGAIASGRGIERAARRQAREAPDTFAASACALRFGAKPATLNNEDHIVPAARLGDAWSLAVIRRATRPLARVLLTVAVAAGIERVVIIGGFALSLGAVYLQLLREELAAECRYSVFDPYVQSLVELGTGFEDACLLGAGVFAGHFLRGER